jgi:hypothetical protein
VYTWRRKKIKHVMLDLKKIETKEIVNGEWPGAKKVEAKLTADE